MSSEKKALSRRAVLMAGAGSGAALAGASALAAPARAGEHVAWSMVTSWPKNLPGPGVTAERLAARITAMSDGRLSVKVHAAGELVPALEVMDAVSGGAAEMGHTASFFWQGKIPASALFTAVPFGLTPVEHMTWVERGGGQALWDALYRPLGVKPFMAGNTGYQMGGWYRKPLTALDDVKGLKIRMPGLGGAVMARLGALPVGMAPGEIFQALQSGVIDATEFLGPWSDSAMGFYKVARFYHWPGFHEPNGTGEALVSLKALEALPAELRAIVEAACIAENQAGLTESEWMNAGALQTLVADHGVELVAFPEEILNAAREAAEAVLTDFASQSPVNAAVWESYSLAASRLGRWADVGIGGFLKARGAR